MFLLCLPLTLLLFSLPCDCVCLYGGPPRLAPRAPRRPSGRGFPPFGQVPFLPSGSVVTAMQGASFAFPLRKSANGGFYYPLLFWLQKSKPSGV